MIAIGELYFARPLRVHISSQCVFFARLKWLEFLEDSKDLYWKPVQTDTQYAPISKNGDLLPDPPNALTVELAEKVAAGHVLPHEARQQQNNQTSRKT